MKKEIFDAIMSWHQEQKTLLNSSTDKVTSFPLELVTLSESITDEKQAREALSCFLEEEINPEKFFWGVPYSLCQPSCDFKLSSGYVCRVENLGWLLIWKYGNKILFLDKNLFGMEKCFDFHNQEPAYRKLLHDIKIRTFIIMILGLLALLCALVK